MATLEEFQTRCETQDCTSRAQWNVTSGGVVKSRHCSKHAQNALKEANRTEQAHKRFERAEAVKS